MVWTLPLLIACVGGVMCCVVLRDRCSPTHYYVTVSGLVWAVVAWGVPAVSSYNPNRYFLVAVPGLALAAGPGLGVAIEWAAARIGRPHWNAGAAACAALLLAVPGVVSYLWMEAPVLGSNALQRDQSAMSTLLPKNAVLYGLYGPELAFSAPVRMVVPWPASGLHMDAPVQRYGVQYVIADVSKYASSLDPAVLRTIRQNGVSLGRPIAALTWGPHKMALFRVRATHETTRTVAVAARH
jgi:hypothetical protein